MKNFTDEEIEKWKRDIEERLSCEHTPFYRILGSEMKALLVRLEAAEKVCNSLHSAHRTVMAIGPENMDLVDRNVILKHLDTWRKVSGK